MSTMTPQTRALVEATAAKIDALLTKLATDLDAAAGIAPKLSGRQAYILGLAQAMHAYAELRVFNARQMHRILDPVGDGQLGWQYHHCTQALDALVKKGLIVKADTDAGSVPGYALIGVDPHRPSHEWSLSIEHGGYAPVGEARTDYLAVFRSFRIGWATGTVALGYTKHEVHLPPPRDRREADGSLKRPPEAPKPARKRAPKGTKPA